MCSTGNPHEWRVGGLKPCAGGQDDLRLSTRIESSFEVIELTAAYKASMRGCTGRARYGHMGNDIVWRHEVAAVMRWKTALSC